jgi:hypothetical protein
MGRDRATFRNNAVDLLAPLVAPSQLNRADSPRPQPSTAGARTSAPPSDYLGSAPTQIEPKSSVGVLTRRTPPVTPAARALLGPHRWRLLLVVVVGTAAAFMVPLSFGGPSASSVAPSHPGSTPTLPAQAASLDLSAAPSSSTAVSLDPTRPPITTTPDAPGQVVGAGVNQTDPFLYLTQGRYFLYGSNQVLPPRINVPVASATDFGAWSPVTDAMPVLPGWATKGYIWSPDVHQFGSTYVLYFDSISTTTGKQCIGLATAAGPVGPFAPSTTPLSCQPELGGDIDPRVFTDTNGTNWMLWKSDQNAGGTTLPTMLWSQPLSADGLSLVGHPTELMEPDEAWQGTIVEAPDMVKVNGVYWVFYSGNWFNHDVYAIGAARCLGPAGPCTDISSHPLLASNTQGAGPGEASVFTDGSSYWMLYTPMHGALYLLSRPIDITRIGFTPAGPYLANGGPPPNLDPLGQPVWSTP